MTNYLLSITEVSQPETVVYTFGDIEEIGYFGKRAPKKLLDEKTYEVFFAEVLSIDTDTDTDAENVKRVILSLTGDAETIAYVLKRKVASERKAAEASNTVPAT